MNLLIAPPVLPMLAKRVDALPTSPGFVFEPKWDGFRTLIFKDGDEVFIQSRDAKSLNRYFPELVAEVLRQFPARCVVDGEIVVARDGTLDFEALQMRVHPAASRVARLSREIPASVVLFDVLLDADTDLRDVAYADRRKRLERLFARAEPPIFVTPVTEDLRLAAEWFERFEGAGLDGVMAKAKDGRYEPNKRVMLKAKHERDCDCVVAGFRWHKGATDEKVGSLLLGIFDDAGTLQHVGVCASFSDEKRRQLVSFLAPYREGALLHHPWKDWGGAEAGMEGRMPGAKSRWSQGKDLSWEPLRPELVVEVAYDHMQGSRFRHTAQFRRWRTDKTPQDCTMAQLEVVIPREIAEIFTAR